MDIQLKQKISLFVWNHLSDAFEKNVSKLKISSFQINPFTSIPLSRVFGSSSNENIARFLVYNRILWTSSSTSFGTVMQKMCIEILGAEASGIPWMDIEFYDTFSKRKTVLQLKSWPNTINSGDVDPVVKEMSTAWRLIKTNGVSEDKMPIFGMGILYGSYGDISTHYKNIASQAAGWQPNIPIYVGGEFWKRLSGIDSFYDELIEILRKEVLKNVDVQKLVEDKIQQIRYELDKIQ